MTRNCRALSSPHSEVRRAFIGKRNSATTFSGEACVTSAVERPFIWRDNYVIDIKNFQKLGSIVLALIIFCYSWPQPRQVAVDFLRLFSCRKTSSAENLGHKNCLSTTRSKLRELSPSRAPWCMRGMPVMFPY